MEIKHSCWFDKNFSNLLKIFMAITTSLDASNSKVKFSCSSLESSHHSSQLIEKLVIQLFIRRVLTFMRSLASYNKIMRSSMKLNEYDKAWWIWVLHRNFDALKVRGIQYDTQFIKIYVYHMRKTLGSSSARPFVSLQENLLQGFLIKYFFFDRFHE